MTTDVQNETLAAIKQAIVALKAQRTYLQDFMDSNVTSPDYFRAKNLDEHASAAIAALNGKTMEILGAEAAQAVADLKKVTQAAQDFIKKVKEIQRGLKVIASFIVLAGAVMVGDAGGIISAAKGVKDAL